MYKYGIVVIGYKNIEGIKRLLGALSRADYEQDNVKLIISIDHSGDDSIKKVADAFCWEFGDKYVMTFPERLGLREHVLRCGDYLNTYDLDVLAVFEDDVMPAKDYYRFTKAATEKYINNENIAGLSLYTNRINFSVMGNFIPVKNDGDNFFIQSAQSRGQVWFRKQWNAFREWYNEQTGVESSYLLPRRVVSWPETSWKKYYIKYCVEKNKYFVYPYISYSTCFGDVGNHVKQQRTDLQVQLSNAHAKEFHLADFDDNALKYDVFFENQTLYQYCNVEKEDLLVDLYGDHVETNKKYILTKKKLPYRVIKSWGDRLIPHEMNLIYDVAGNDIFLYETDQNGEFFDLPQRIVPRTKMQIYFDILDRWMASEEQGIDLEQLFLKKQLQHIAIYGYGKLGKHLYNRLKNTSVQVDYYIDQNTVSESEGIKIIKASDDLPAVDGIIVTPVMEFETIKTELEQKQRAVILSIEDIFE